MENQLVQITETEIAVSETGQLFDTQIATAKQYPRSITRVVENSIATVTIDEATAQSCTYTLPKGGKQIPGASVHLARIVAQFYGNIRVQVKAGEIGKSHLIAHAIAFDLESNYAIQVETRRKILTSKGERYGEDMINTTMLAAMAVAERNAIFKVIPKGIIDKVYNAAKNKIAGKLTNEQEMASARKKTLEYFDKTHGVNEADILEFLGKKALTNITSDDIVILRGLVTALKDGETTIENTFKRFAKEEKKAEVKDKNKELFQDK